MLTLAIDCATEACSVALFEGENCVAGEFRLLGRGHAEQLVPMIAALPGRGEAQRILVALGPGSFTGVRVGLAAARALAFAWNAELLGYPTLSLIAAMAHRAIRPVPVAVVMTGGHGEWFVQRFTAGGVPAEALASRQPADAEAHVGEEFIAGSQARALVALRGHGEALDLLPDARAANLLAPATLTSDIRPIYGRAPDARLPASAP
ncbi:MAG: tRNA (adenosine(37)-N6)-threonylcarbamoyltransferase complex dimerization subunit type 1 TsaB [Novosphingobium sp.]